MFIAGCVLLLSFASLKADDKQARVLMQAAETKATVEGDLKAAIALYQNAVKEAGPNRGIAAQALLRRAECYQKLGDAEANKIYERLIRDFADQNALYINYQWLAQSGAYLLFDLGRSTMDPAKRRKVYADLERLMLEDAPWVFLLQQVDIYASRDRVSWTPRAPSPAFWVRSASTGKERCRRPSNER
jgi:tetratricopeptide (TPR) repeat protein